jgi:hypothetical protein
MSGSFDRYLCLSTDVQGYSRRHDRSQSALQEELLGLLDQAAESVGLHRQDWHRQGSGDGELALVPPSEPESRVVDDFVRALDMALFQHNYDRRPDDRLRLRLAVDHGPVQVAANGYAGHPVVAVSRLVNSRPLRLAVAAAHANLAVILSGRVYTDLVRGGHTQSAPEDYRMVPVREKEFHEDAWIRVPGVDLRGVDLGGDEQARPDPPAVKRGRLAPWPGQQVANEITGTVNAPGGVFGIQNN